MFLSILILFICFVLSALSADNFMLARWVWGTYVVPTFYPSVITCNTDENPLAVVYTLNTIEKRTHVVVAFTFFLQTMVVHGIFSTMAPTLYAYALAIMWGSWCFYSKPPVAVLMESIPYSGATMTFEAYVEKKETEMTARVYNQVKGYIVSGPSSNTIVQAIRAANYVEKGAIELLQKKEKVEGDYNIYDNGDLIEEYQTVVYPMSEYHVASSPVQQGLYKTEFYELAKKYNVNLKNVSFVTGNPSLLTNYCGPCRVPARVPKDTEFIQRDIDDENDSYELWFDEYVTKKPFMSIFSYGALSTVQYGVQASPNTRVCLFSQSLCWEDNGLYAKSKNVLPNWEAAHSIINHAWLALHVPDDYVLQTEENFVSYMGQTVQNSIETVEHFHGNIDTATKTWLEHSALSGGFPLYDSSDQTLVLPNFTTAAILLNPWLVLYQCVLNKRTFDFTLLPFYGTKVSGEQIEQSWTDGDIYTLGYNEYSFKALDKVVMSQTFSTDILKKVEKEEESDDDEANDADTEEDTVSDEEEDATTADDLQNDTTTI